MNKKSWIELSLLDINIWNYLVFWVWYWTASDDVDLVLDLSSKQSITIKLSNFTFMIIKNGTF